MPGPYKYKTKRKWYLQKEICAVLMETDPVLEYGHIVCCHNLIIDMFSVGDFST